MSNLQHNQQAQNQIHPQSGVPSGNTSSNPLPRTIHVPVTGAVPISYPMTQPNAGHHHPLAGNLPPVTTFSYYNPYATLPSSSQVNQGSQFVSGHGGGYKGKSTEGYSMVGPSSMMMEVGGQRSGGPGPSSMASLSSGVGAQQNVRVGPVVAGPSSRLVEVESRGSVRPGPIAVGASSTVPLSGEAGPQLNFQARPDPVMVGPSSVGVPLSIGVRSQQSVAPGPIVAGPSFMAPMSAEAGSELSARPGPVRGETVLVQNATYPMQRNFQGHDLIPAITPWGWSLVPAMPYINGSGATGSAINQEQNQVVQVTNFQLYPSPVYPSQGHLQPLHQLPQPVYAPLYSQEAGPSYAPLMRSSSYTNPSPFQVRMEAGPGFVGPVSTTGLGVYGPSNRGSVVPGVTMRPHALPNLFLLPADEAALSEILNYTDQHRALRMDVDGMSYEELLALEERMGSVETGLSKKTISNYLQTRIYTSSAIMNDAGADRCTICLSHYANREVIGKLDCGHEYHADCIKQWLVIKNTCPICKCPALRDSKREG